MDLVMLSGEEGVNLETLFVEEVDTINDNRTIKLRGQGAFKTDLHWNPDSKKPRLTHSFISGLASKYKFSSKLSISNL